MRSTIVAACAAFAVLLPAVAAAEPVLQPIQIGAETLRFDQGVPTLDLQRQQGSVQIRPLPLDHGSPAFSVAVFNASPRSANFGIENLTVQAGDKPVSVFSVDQLVRKAKSRARWTQIGIAMLGGIAAGVAASQTDTYHGYIRTPRGSYVSSYSGPSAFGQLQATALTAGAAHGIAAVQYNLDRTRDVLGDSIVQTTTLYPQQSYAGKIVLEKIPLDERPVRISIVVMWNGEQYPFAFQFAKAGTAAPVFHAVDSAPAQAAAEPSMAAAAYPARQPRPAPTPATGGARSQDINALITKTALYMERPTELDDGTVISEFAVSGSELRLTAALPKGMAEFSDGTRMSASRAICGRRAFVPLLQGGATIRATYSASSKRRAEEIIVTSSDCVS